MVSRAINIHSFKISQALFHFQDTQLEEVGRKPAEQIITFFFLSMSMIHDSHEFFPSMIHAWLYSTS